MEEFKRGEPVRADAQWPVGYEASDEISLFDLWAVLVRRKWVLAVVWCLTTGLAIAYAFLASPQYRFFMPIEVGSRLAADDTVQLITPPEAVVAKLEKNYIPLAIADALKGETAPDWQPRIAASAPESSDIVVLEAEGAADRGPVYAGLFQSIVDALVADHDRVTRVERAKLSGRIENARNAVRSAEEKTVRLKGELERLDERDELLGEEIKTLTQELATLRNQRRQLARQSGDGQATGTLAMLSSDVHSVTERLSQLRTARRVDIPSERARLEAAIEDQRRAVDNRRAQVDTLQAQIETLSATRPLSTMQRSTRPTGPGAPVIVALGLILGAMLGIFAAFGLEFVQQANRHARAPGRV